MHDKKPWLISKIFDTDQKKVPVDKYTINIQGGNYIQLTEIMQTSISVLKMWAINKVANVLGHPVSVVIMLVIIIIITGLTNHNRLQE